MILICLLRIIQTLNVLLKIYYYIDKKNDKTTNLPKGDHSPKINNMVGIIILQ